MKDVIYLDELETGVLYFEEKSQRYFVCTGGYEVIWHDTEDQAYERHGENLGFQSIEELCSIDLTD